MRPLVLSSQEAAALAAFARAEGRVVGRQELQRRIGITQRAPRRCDAIIVGLRRALGADAIVTVRGRGWRCLADLADLADLAGMADMADRADRSKPHDLPA